MVQIVEHWVRIGNVLIPQPLRWWYHGPRCGVATDFLKRVKHVKAHGRKAVKVAITVHLFGKEASAQYEGFRMLEVSYIV